MKKITLATFKSFVRKNAGNLYVKVKSSFDGMIDGVRHDPAAAFEPAAPADRTHTNNLGIAGVWLVFGSRDYFNAYDDGTFAGIYVYNCCGSFVVATKKGGA